MTDLVDEDGNVKVPDHVWQYAQSHQLMIDAAKEIRLYLEELAISASVPLHLIESRPKGLISYRDKSAKEEEEGGGPKYSDPKTQIHDLVAARAITFTVGWRNELADLIESRCEGRIIERKNPGAEKYNGYDSEHIVISGFKDPAVLERLAALKRYFAAYPGLEIQVRSVAGHAWAEYEHDIRYKPEAHRYRGLSSSKKKEVDQYFIEAGGMRRVMDELFDRIDRILTQGPGGQGAVGAGDQDPPDPDDQGADAVGSGDTRSQDPATCADDTSATTLDSEAIQMFALDRFDKDDEPGEDSDYEMLAAHLSGLGITTVGQLQERLETLTKGQVAELMDYPTKMTRARKLDDELLATFKERYVDAASPDDRKDLLRVRLRRVQGAFAIYLIEGLDPPQTGPVTAARAVRDLIKFVAERTGVEDVEIDGMVSSRRDTLSSSAPRRPVKALPGHTVYIMANLSRAQAERLMHELATRVPGSDIRVMRAGDPIAKAPPREESGE